MRRRNDFAVCYKHLQCKFYMCVRGAIDEQFQVSGRGGLESGEWVREKDDLE